MILNNGTSHVTEFILLGFSFLDQTSRRCLCALLSSVYVLTLAGNLCIMWAILQDPRLHRLPMYVLLGNFSFLEICYITTTVPQMLVDLATPQADVISFQACFLQPYFFFSMGTTECFFLSAMALDRYLAICHPLRYPSLMSQWSCLLLVVSCWVCGFLWFIIPIVLTSQLPFHHLNILDHFLCDPVPLVAVSCVPAPYTEHVRYSLSSLLLFSTFLFILASYAMVLKAVMKLPRGAGRRKAFSTCTSHLAVVGLFYGTVMVAYANPAASGSSGKTVTLFYAVVTPLFNPLIYSLRNKEVKEALRRTLLGER